MLVRMSPVMDSCGIVWRESDRFSSLFISSCIGWWTLMKAVNLICAMEFETIGWYVVSSGS